MFTSNTKLRRVSIYIFTAYVKFTNFVITFYSKTMTYRSTVVNSSNYHDDYQFLSAPTTGISSGNHLLHLNWQSTFKNIDVILQQMIPQILLTFFVDNRVIRIPLTYGASNAFLSCFWVEWMLWTSNLCPSWLSWSYFADYEKIEYIWARCQKEL